MKNSKHVESFGEFNENLNISDVRSSNLKINEMANTHKTKKELVDYLIGLISSEQI